jgi:hypothetical protein
MGEAEPPFGERDAVVIDRPSRHRGLELTVVAFADREPRIRAYLHTRGWKRILTVGLGRSAADAADSAEELLDRARRLGVRAGPAA